MFNRGSMNTNKKIFTLGMAGFLCVGSFLFYSAPSSAAAAAAKPTANSTTTAQAADALDKPNISNAAILTWAENAVKKTFTYSYKDYKQVIDDSSKYFTSDNFKSFKTALDKSGNIDTLKKHKVKITTTLSGSPKIIKQEIVQGRYTWEIELPTKISYETEDPNTAPKVPDELMTVLQIIRMPKDQNAEGIAINGLTQQHKK